MINYDEMLNGSKEENCCGIYLDDIDDNEIENLRKICDELFGLQNYVGTVIWERAFSPKNDAKYFSVSHD